MGGNDSNGDNSNNVVIPQTGAGPYWYVDPNAPKNYDPMAAYRTPPEQEHETNDPVSRYINDLVSTRTVPDGGDELRALNDALARMGGVLPEGAQPSF
jgi:hypothetical protein